jgi:hypothetical protein
MTRDKGFKRRVRERMAMSGERYAVARRALLKPADKAPAAAVTTDSGVYSLRGGLHPDTAVIANILANDGVVSPVDGRPLSEAMILGVGGGLGAGYILWEFKSRGAPIVTLGFRNRWQYPGIPGWQGTLLERLGIGADVDETTGRVGARASLERRLGAGRLVIAILDQQSAGIWGLPDVLSGYWGYSVVVFGRDSGTYLVDDRGTTPLRISEETMADARGRITSYRNRLVSLSTTPGPIGADVLRWAIDDGLRAQVEHLRSRSDSFSLPAWRKWSRLMTDTRNVKAWPRVFVTRFGLFGTLLSLVEAIDGEVGASGGHLRDLYADFLQEAAVVLDRPALDGAARPWRHAADLWEDLADHVVPPDLDGALEAVEAAEDLHAAVMRGEPGRAAAGAAAATVWAARDRYLDSVPLSDAAVTELFADIGARLAAIHAAEVAAVDALADALR